VLRSRSVGRGAKTSSRVRIQGTHSGNRRSGSHQARRAVRFCLLPGSLAARSKKGRFIPVRIRLGIASSLSTGAQLRLRNTFSFINPRTKLMTADMTQHSANRFENALMRFTQASSSTPCSISGGGGQPRREASESRRRKLHGPTRHAGSHTHTTRMALHWSRLRSRSDLACSARGKLPEWPATPHAHYGQAVP
jgi:hypothetical protein